MMIIIIIIIIIIFELLMLMAFLIHIICNHFKSLSSINNFSLRKECTYAFLSYKTFFEKNCLSNGKKKTSVPKRSHFIGLMFLYIHRKHFKTVHT